MILNESGQALTNWRAWCIINPHCQGFVWLLVSLEELFYVTIKVGLCWVFATYYACELLHIICTLHCLAISNCSMNLESATPMKQRKCKLLHLVGLF